MRTCARMKVLNIIGILITSIYVTIPVIAAGNEDNNKPVGMPENKVSSLLSLHIKMKQAQPAFTSQNTMKPFGVEPESIGETTLVDKERVFLHFTQPPTNDQINELASLGVTVYPDSWIPPVNNFKTGFILAGCFNY